MKGFTPLTDLINVVCCVGRIEIQKGWCTYVLYDTRKAGEVDSRQREKIQNRLVSVRTDNNYQKEM